MMQHLKHVETTVGEEPETKNATHSLKMVFDDAVSEFFSPSTLEVTLVYETEDQVKEVKGTEITWVEGKDPTKKKIKKKQKHKKTGETRTVVKTVDAESFFNIFQNRVAPKEGECDSDEENESNDKIDEVQQIVEDFHDLMIPDALEYYLGLNEDFDMLGLDGEEPESASDDDEEGDDDDKDKKKKKKEEGGAGEGQQECKQQ